MSIGTRRGRRVTRRLAISAAVSCAALTIVALAAAAGSASFTDAAGDSASGPDITSVRVSHDDAGLITFAVTVANRFVATPNLVVMVFLDTDRNESTGHPVIGGADFVIAKTGHRGRLGTWNGTDFEYVDERSLTPSHVAGIVRINVGTTQIGNSQSFRFLVAALEVDNDETLDLAPDDEMWSYSPATSPHRLTASGVTVAPARPASGGPFTASMTVRSSDTGGAPTQASVTCRVTLNGRPVAARGSFAGGRATCSGRVPRRAAGKTVRGTITVKSGAASVTRTFSARIAR